MDKKTVGERLRKARLDRKLKQQELADKAICARTSIVRWEDGAVIPSDILVRICDVLEVPVTYMLFGELVPEDNIRKVIETMSEIYTQEDMSNLSTESKVKLVSMILNHK
jgi:transcriptional regulator with XRE-family HTH domain